MPQPKPCKHKHLRSARKQTIAEAAEELGLHAETVREFVRDGCPASKQGNSYRVDAPEVSVWMKANGHTGKQGRPWPEDSPDLEAARLRKENALASKYECQTARERGQLMPIDDVKTMGATAISSFRNSMLGLAPKLAVMLEGRSAAERQDIIEKEIKHSLDELSRRMEQLGKSNEAA